MTITFHAGRRIQGTSSDRTSVSYTQDYSNAISTYSPTFFLKIDEGTGTSLANTGSNTGYTASLDVSNGNPAWVDGVTGYAVSIDGSSSYTAPKITTSDLPTNQNQAYSFTMTMKLTGTLPTSGRTWFWVWGNGNLAQYHIGVDWASGSVYYGYYNNGWYYITGTSGDITDGEWHTIGTTHSSGQAVKLYIDGSQVGSGTGNDTYGYTEQANTIKPSTSGVTLIVDSVFFKNTVLTDSDMQGIHNNLLTGNLILGNNVQSGSRFEATDTRKIYYGALGDDNSSADLNEDFTGSSSTHSGDGTTVAGWRSSDASDIYYDGSNDWLYWNISRGTNDSISYDLGAGNVSDTAWILRFNVQWDAFVSNAYNEQRWGISDQSSATAHNGTHKFIGCMTQFWDSVSRTLTPSSANSGAIGIDSGGWTYDWDGVLATNTYVYIEIKRINSTQYTISASSTDAYDGDLSTSGNLTCPNVTGLRYIWFGNENAGSDDATMNSKTNEVKFWNGVTSVPQTIQWTEEV